MWLLQEAADHGIHFNNTKPKVHCTVFEDNEGAIEIANVPKMRPRTKHLNLKYHHFREEVKKGTISIYHVSTKDQMADIFTKPLVGIATDIRNQFQSQSPVRRTSGLRLRLRLIFLRTLVQLCTYLVRQYHILSTSLHTCMACTLNNHPQHPAGYTSHVPKHSTTYHQYAAAGSKIC